MSSNNFGNNRFTIFQVRLLQELKKSGLSNEGIIRGLQDLDNMKNTWPIDNFHRQSFYNKPSGTSSTNGTPDLSSATSNGSPRPIFVKKRRGRPRKNLYLPVNRLPNGRVTVKSNKSGKVITSKITLLNSAKKEFVATDSYQQPKLSELVREPLNDVRSKIRRFMKTHKIAQARIEPATDYQVSQRYLSRWLSGSSRVINSQVIAIYKWYLGLVEKYQTITQPSLMSNSGTAGGSSNNTANDNLNQLSPEENVLG